MVVGPLSLDSDDTAREASSRVAGGERQLVSSLAEVIDALVHDETASDDAVLSDERHQRVGDGGLDLAVGIGLHVAEVANVALVISGTTVSLQNKQEWQEEKRTKSRGTVS